MAASTRGNYRAGRPRLAYLPGEESAQRPEHTVIKRGPDVTERVQEAADRQRLKAALNLDDGWEAFGNECTTEGT